MALPRIMPNSGIRYLGLYQGSTCTTITLTPLVDGIRVLPVNIFRKLTVHSAVLEDDRPIELDELSAPAVVFIVAVLGGEPVAMPALVESFSAKTMIAGALLGTLAALAYWRIVHRRQTRFGSPLLSDLA